MNLEIKHLLIVDDDDRIRELLSKYLREKGFFISNAGDGEEALEIFKLFIFDLVIVDIMMPKLDGNQFTEIIRSSSNTPILMLTAINDVDSRIKGFELGINDYMAKPFDPRELLFRIKNILNINNNIVDNELEFIKFGDFEYDPKSNRLVKNTEIISLTTSETKLLTVLVQNKSKMISREKLAKLCGGINERSVDVQIVRLRNKIEKDPKNPYFLQTIRGEGYIFYA